ncbi:unnamed protein product, partial [Scytosiphon promiscuus]
ARSTLGLPTVGSPSLNTDKLGLSGHDEISPTSKAMSQQPVQEMESTRRSRFAALARTSGNGRENTRGHTRSLVGRRENIREESGDDGSADGATTTGNQSFSSPKERFRTAGRCVVRQGLERSLVAAPNDETLLRRLGRIEATDGDLGKTAKHLHLAAQGSRNDNVWVALARVEVLVWERDPAVGHEHLRRACDAYERSIDLLEPGFAQVWELPARLLELGGVYESFGSFEGALHIYQRIASSMPLSSGFADVLFRCAVVMRYMSILEGAPRNSLLHSAQEHLDLIMQDQTSRLGSPAESVALLYADVCMSLAEGSEAAREWAKASYQEVFNKRKSGGDVNALAFREWDDWIASADTQVQLAQEWCRKGEPTLAVIAFEKALKAFELDSEISPDSKSGPTFAVLMDASEAWASFQRFSRAETMVRKALLLEPESEEAKYLLKKLVGNEDCRRKEMRLQVALHVQSKWRTRVWQAGYLRSLKSNLKICLEGRLENNRMEIDTREQLSYFFREKYRPVLLYEDRCARIIQRLGRAGLFRLRWFAVKRKTYRKQLTSALKLWQKDGYEAESREIIRSRASNRYTPSTHKIVSVVALMDRQDRAIPFIQRAARSLLARKMMLKILKSRTKDLKRKRRAAAVHLQCQVRGYLARRELDRRVALVAARTRAATSIQTVYRDRALLWEFAVKRAQYAHERDVAEARFVSARKLQATWRMKRGYITVADRRRAVLNIQRSFRGFLGRKRSKGRKKELITRIQASAAQYRRHRERLVIVQALLAIRISRDHKEARAKEIERRFRALEQDRMMSASGDGIAAVTPLEERRAARTKDRLLSRMKAKGSGLVRARKWGKQHAVKSRPPESPASPPPDASLASSAVRHAIRSVLRPITPIKSGNDLRISLRHPKSRRDNQSCAPCTHGASVLPFARGELFTDGKNPPEPAKDTTATLFLGHTNSVERAIIRRQASRSTSSTVGDGAICRLLHDTGKRPKSHLLQVSTPSALAAALAAARGVGHRFGTPLGNPHPTPGLTWATWSASVKPNAAIRRAADVSEGRPFPSAPGSRFFPPSVHTGAVDCSPAGGSPVVLEMVRDAADDEDETASVCAGPANDPTEAGAGRNASWHGLTRYRPPGISRRSLNFQHALQLETVTFSPSVKCSSSPAPHMSACPDSTPDPECCATSLDVPTADSNGACGRSTARRSSSCCGRRGGGYREKSGRWVDIAGHRKRQACFERSVAVEVAVRPPCIFDSGDMIMTAGLLAHPESALKRLILHRARLDTSTGREALLKSLEINKLSCLALGGCTWFDDATKADQRKHGWASDRWWEEVCTAIRMNGFGLQEIVVEGLDKGGDSLGVALGATLQDHFAEKFGSLASIALVRCGMSDKGATAVARGIFASNTLTYVDLSGNTISDTGVQQLVKAIAGGSLPTQDAEGDTVKRKNETNLRPLRRKIPVLRVLDLGQNRIMDPGGVLLATVLLRTTALRSLTVSHNFMMEQSAQALLSAAVSTGGILREIHCDGNLFDET